ncbi:1178_t:CDS:2 [Entrophospora sp. SA101]|nr:1178_t:CDS:2 [Entrophospora sp. SA101]
MSNSEDVYPVSDKIRQFMDRDMKLSAYFMIPGYLSTSSLASIQQKGLLKCIS